MSDFLAVLYYFSVIWNDLVHNFNCLPHTEGSYCLKLLQETSGDCFPPCLSIIFTGYHKPPDNSNSIVLMRRLISHFHDICAIASLADLCIISYVYILPISMLTSNEKQSLTRLIMLVLKYNL